MATLTEAEKIVLMRAIERKAQAADIPMPWAKACLFDVGQAIEDILSGSSFQSAVSGAIDGTASPYSITFSNNEKKWLLAFVMELKHTRDLLG